MTTDSTFCADVNETLRMADQPSILMLGGLPVLVLAFLSQAAADDRPRAGQATESPSPGLQSGAQADASDSNSDSTNDEESEEKSRSKLAEGQRGSDSEGGWTMT